MTTLQPRFLLPLTEKDPDAEAVWTPTASLTWSELENRARRLAYALVDRGLEPGERWAVLAHNRVEWPEFLLGNTRAGTKMAPLNWHLTPRELDELLTDSGARLLVVDETLEDAGRQAARSAGLDPTDVVVLGPFYEAWLAASPDTPLPDWPMGSSLLYTGGTTGRSKGVTRSDTAGPVSQWPQRSSAWGAQARLPTEGVGLVTTPLYHSLAQGFSAAAVARRHTLSILPRFDAETTLRTISRRRVTATPMVPTQFIRLLKLHESIRSAHDLSSLKWVLHTAAPCPPWVKRDMIEWFGPVIYELYGSSEGTGPVISSSREWLERPGTVGRASAALTLSIVDDEGRDLPPGEIGTIYVKRRDGAPEYHGDPDKTAAGRLPDGRFTVGDLGWLDEDGFLYLADRRVDLIITGGSNVYPAEIEGVLSEHPSVADVAVFGIPDEEFGEQIKAVVEPVPRTSPDPAEIIAFARERLATFKVPRSVDIVDRLPREAHGKLKKRLLRDPYWD